MMKRKFQDLFKKVCPEEVDKLIKDKAQLEKDLKKALENNNYKHSSRH